MNYNKHSFTSEQFLTLPVYESAWGAPVGVPFLINGQLSAQQDALKFILNEETEDKLAKRIEDETKATGKDHSIKVKFWQKYKDGNVSERGARLKLISQGLNLVDDTLVIKTGE